MTAPSPSGEFQLVSYSQSVTSSITGPVEEAFGFGSLRMILPKEVVIVSTFVMPVMLSFMTWLELTLDIPGASPIYTVPMDSSGIFKQAVTPSKLHGRVEGFAGPPLLWMERVQMEKVLLEDRWETSQVLSGSKGRIFLSISKSRLAEGSPQWQLLAKTDVIPYAIQKTSWFIPWVVVPVQGVSLGCQVGKGLLNLFLHMPLGRLIPKRPPHWWRSDTTSPLL